MTQPTDIHRPQVHHILPNELLDGFGELFKDLGIDLNAGQNLIMLFERDEDAAKVKRLYDGYGASALGDVPLGSVRHWGSHDSYTRAVEDRLRLIADMDARYDAHKKLMIEELQVALRQMLMEGDVPLMGKSRAAIDRYLDARGLLSPEDFDANGNIRADRAEKLSNAQEAVKLHARADMKHVYKDNDDFVIRHTDRIRPHVLALDSAEPFLSASSYRYFTDDKEWTGKVSRGGIYKMVYDLSAFESRVENNLAALQKYASDDSNPVLQRAARHRLAYLKAWQAARNEALAISGSGHHLQRLQSMQADADAYNLLIQMKKAGGKGDIDLVLRDYGEGGRKLKDSALWKSVLPEIYTTDAYDKYKINGVSIGTLRLRANGMDAFRGMVYNLGSTRFLTTQLDIASVDSKTARTLLKSTALPKSVKIDQLTDEEVYALLARERRNINIERLSTKDANAVLHALSENMPETFREAVEQRNRLLNEALGGDGWDLGKYFPQGLMGTGGKLLTMAAVFPSITGFAKAKQDGDDEKANKYLWDLGALAVADKGLELGSFALSLLAGGGRLVSGGIGLLVGILDAEFDISGKAIDFYYKTTLSDKDYRKRLLDDLDATLFGHQGNVHDMIFQLKKKNLSVQMIGVDIASSAVAALAKDDEHPDVYAYRYALKYMNPFVIAGIDYEALMTENAGAADMPFPGDFDELRRADRHHSSGMSDAYIEQRALLMESYIRHAVYGEASSREFVVTEASHMDKPWAKLPVVDKPVGRTVFGGIADETLIGTEGKDYLFGDVGEDTLRAVGSGDYLEGGSGNNTYEINNGSHDVEIYDPNPGSKILVNGTEFKITGKEENLHKLQDSDVWLTDDYRLQLLDNGDLRVTSRNEEIDVSFTVKAWRKRDLGIDPTDLGKNFSDPVKLYEGDWRAKVIGKETRTDVQPGEAGYGTYAWGSAERLADGSLLDGVEEADFADVIRSGNDDSRIKGHGGDDALGGGSGRDEIHGGEGSDLLTGGSGEDRIHGGEGNDFISSNSSLIAPGRYKPDDQWKAPDNALEVLQAGSTWGIYTVKKDDGSATMMWDGVSHVNTRKARDEGDHIYGGKGDDHVIGSWSDDFIWGDESLSADGDGADWLDGLAGDDVIHGGGGADVIFGDGILKPSFLNTVPGHEHGNDTLYGEEGNDAITGGGGNDVIYGNSPHGNTHALPWEGASDDDQLWGDAGDLDPEFHGTDRIFGGVGNDHIIGHGKDDQLYGGVGDDAIWGDGGEAPEERNKDVRGNDALYGEEGNDKLYGGFGDDVLDGGEGDDALHGQDDNDTLLGGAGNDSLYGDMLDGQGNPQGEQGKDMLYGGEGDDFLIGGGNDDVLHGGKGDDKLWGDSGKVSQEQSEQAIGNDSLDGGDGNDYLDGGYGDDSLEGGSGNDKMFGGIGQDRLSGGAGNDWMWGDTAGIEGDLKGETYNNDDYLDGGAGNDDLTGGLGDDVLIGGDGDDRLWGDDGEKEERDARIKGNDVLSGGAGNDYLDGGYGDDRLDGGSDNDTLRGGHGQDVLSGGHGEDILHGGAGNDVLDGGSGNDRLFGEEGNDVLAGGVGDDLLVDDAGDDWMSGGSGNDQLSAGEGNDVLMGDEGDDLLIAGNGDDRLIGGAGNDELQGKQGRDTYVFSGNWGQDRIFEEDGNNVLHFETLKTDEVRFVRYENHLIVSDKKGGNYVAIINQFGDKDDTSGFVEAVVFADGKTIDRDEIRKRMLASTYDADVIHGTERNDTLAGSAGDDELFGHGGDDVLRGEEDNDSLVGGAGADRLYGGEGDDALVGDTGSAENDLLEAHGNNNDYLDGEAGNDRLTGGIGDDVLVGGDGDDRLWGDDGKTLDADARIQGNDVLSGGEGNDYLDGGYGDDVLDGGAGDDLLYGGPGQDELSGGDGEDKLDAGSGHDVLKGGTGKDELLGHEGDDRLYGDEDNDALFGGAGADKLYGGAGDDFLAGDTGSVTNDLLDAQGNHDDYLDGEAGNDHLIGGIGNDVLVGGDGDDRLWGDDGKKAGGDERIQGNDVLSGGAGNDYLDGGYGDDTLDGGVGNDRLQGGHGQDTLSGGHGEDILHGGAGNDTLDGGEGNDELNGDAGNDIYRFAGNFGHDRITNHDVAENRKDIILFEDLNHSDINIVREHDHLILSGKEGNRKITVNYHFRGADNSSYRIDEVHFADGEILDQAALKAIVLQGGDGDDRLYAFAEGSEVSGGLGNDQLYGNDGNDRLSGDAGNDYLDGRDGEDHLAGGAGHDYLSGGNGNDTLDGGEGNDELLGDDGNDVLDGGVGNDSLSGEDGDDVLDGGEGNDRLSGGTGNDVYRFAGNFGHDHINNNDAGRDRKDIVLFADLQRNDLTVTRKGNDLVLAKRGGENQVVVQSHFHNEGKGHNRIDEIHFADGEILDNAALKVMVLQGSDGDDYLYAYVEGSELSGGLGNDHLHGNIGNDRLSGGEGNDFLYGGNGDDNLAGGAGNDSLYGNHGNDNLDGGAGNDSLSGNDGNDNLNGGTGNDTLSGGNGDDVIDGGEGNDQLSGDVGNDTYRFAGNFGHDTISNHDSGKDRKDTILFANLKRNELTIARNEDNLIIADRSGKNQVVVNKHFHGNGKGNNYYRIDEIRFADGEILDNAAISAMVLQGGDGDDHLYAYADGSELDGGAGNDTLYGAEGNDTLKGGEGNDRLEGKGGRDIYAFSGDWGQDTIIDDGKNNRIRFDDLLPEHIRLLRGWHDETQLIVRKNNDDGVVVVQNQFSGASAQDALSIGEWEFADGSVLTSEEAYALLMYRGTDQDDNLYGDRNNNRLVGREGNDQLFGKDGDDYLDGGDGNDILNGGAGADTLDGGKGDDVYKIDRGDTVIIREDSGNDQLHVPTNLKASLQDVTIRLERELTADQLTLTRKDFDDAVAEYDYSKVDPELIISSKNGNYKKTFQETMNYLSKETIRHAQYGRTYSIGIGSFGTTNHFNEENTISFIFERSHDQKIEWNEYFSNVVHQDQWYLHYDPADSRKIAIRKKADLNDDLILNLGNGDQLNLNGALKQLDNLGDMRFAFKNGEELTLKQLLQKHLDQAETAGDDLIRGFASHDILRGGDGNDGLQGGEGDDILEGGAGDDLLVGGYYSRYWNTPDSIYKGYYDTPVRYEGLAPSGLGNDTYVFASGHGHDTVVDRDRTPGNQDTLWFKDVSTLDDLSFRKSGNNLLIQHRQEDASVTVVNYFQPYGDRSWQVEALKLADNNAVILQDAQLSGLLTKGTDENDELFGIGDVDDVINGHAGDDLLVGGAGNDTLNGGSGNDRLNGGAGDNTFVFDKGWGQDVIYSSWHERGGHNVIRFSDVVAEELQVRKTDSGLVIHRKGSEDRIDIQLEEKENPLIKQVVFADGTSWDSKRLWTLSTTGSDEADVLTGSSGEDVIHGGGGDDVITATQGEQNRLYGEAGNDTLSGSGELHGGEGNDTLTGKGRLYGGDGNDQLTGSGELYGDAGNDHLVLQDESRNPYGYGGHYPPNDPVQEPETSVHVLDGGEGNDILDASNTPMRFGDSGAGFVAPEKGEARHILRGGSGNDILYGSNDNDVYAFSSGDGHDTIIERKADKAYSNVHASYDVIRFSQGIQSDDVAFSRQGNDLLIRYGDDSITVQNHYNVYNRAYHHFRINEVQFADGSSITESEFERRSVWQGTDGADQMIGRDSAETIDAGKGDDKIFAKGGDDTLRGGEGHDYLSGDDGNDILQGNVGNDTLSGGAGNDILDGGAGDDKYYYRPGDGQDIIDQHGGGRDGVFFLDVTADRLSYHRKENHLVMLVDKDLTQQVQVKDHFAGDDKAISYVQPAKGASVSKAQIAQKLTELPANGNTAVNGASANAAAAHNVNSMVNAMATFTKQVDDGKLTSPQDLAPATSLAVPT